MIEGKLGASAGGEIVLRVDRNKSVLSKLSLYDLDLNGATVSVSSLDDTVETQIFSTASEDSVIVEINKPADSIRIRTDTGGAAMVNFSYVERE